MSCEKNGVKCAGAAVLSGIGQTASKFGNATGVMLNRIVTFTDASTRVTGKIVSPVSSKVLKATDRPATIAANVTPYLAALAAITAVRVYAFGPFQGVAPSAGVAVALKTDPQSIAQFMRTLKAIALIQGVKRGSAKILGDLATLTQEQEGERILVSQRSSGTLAGATLMKMGNKPAFGAGIDLLGAGIQMGAQRSIQLPGSKQEVQFAKSRLTALINRQDVLVSRKRIVMSEGDLVRTQSFRVDLSSPAETLKHPLVAMTWHRGTTVVRMPGRKGTYTDRTLTHLRSLTVPSQSIYFDRALSDEEVAEIVAGNGRKPSQIEGYVGAIGDMENIFLGWASLKRSMILTHLHWPPASSAWITVKPQAEDLSLKEALSNRKHRRSKTNRAILQDMYKVIRRGGFSEKQKNAAERATSPEIEQIEAVTEPGDRS